MLKLLLIHEKAKENNFVRVSVIFWYQRARKWNKVLMVYHLRTSLTYKFKRIIL